MKKYSLGYTTGVFDMFHVGHLHLLKQAKNNCEYLIVGVSTDEMVVKHKNKLPIIPFSDRVEIISSLSCVDKVVPQVNKNKMEQYYDIKFDVMFVGDDWKDSELFLEVEKKLKKFKVDVIYFKYTKKVSSTKFTEILQSLYDEDLML